MILQGTLYSQALDMETGAVFVAADDCGAAPPRKVAYLLHGLQGRYDDFLHYTVLPDLCRSYHCLFVLPDGQRSFYTDMACGNEYFTYLTRELPALVSDLFRVSSAPEDTVILGASMGGFGALKAALTFPDRYAACAAFSPCCLDLADYLRPAWRSGEEGDAFRRIFGDKLAADFLAAFGPDGSRLPENDLLSLAKAAAETGVRPRVFTCWGSEDIFRDTNRRFPRQMAALGWPIESRELPGHMHNWVFFNEALKLALPFCLGEA